MKICIIVGARPNFVKVAPLMRAVAKHPDVACQLVWAGLEDDPTLEPTLFDDLQMPRPDVCLGVDTCRVNEITAQVMARFDAWLDQHPADVVIVVDDLASTMAAAITAKKRGIRLAHLVAGTRSFDITMPKEINRLVIDALSDYLFTAGTRSNSVATREQHSETSQTWLVGNILMDTLRHSLPRLRKPHVSGLPDPEATPYLVLTVNRRALLADEPALQAMLTRLVESGYTIVAPLRPLAREAVARLVPPSPRLLLASPLPYLEFGWLTAHATAIITDSGNVAEEATFNGVPCITLNDYTEHIETVTQGTNILVGGSVEKLTHCLEDLKRGTWKKGSLPYRWDGRTADRIIQILLG